MNTPGDVQHRWCVERACLTDVVYFVVVFRKNTWITVALCVWRHPVVILGTMTLQHIRQSGGYSLNEWSDFVTTWYVCDVILVCDPCTWRLKLISRLRVMSWETTDEEGRHSPMVYRFHGMSSSLWKIMQWDHVRKWTVLTVFRLLMWVCGTYVFVRFKRYFHPGES